MASEEILKNTKVLSSLSDDDLDIIANLDRNIEDFNNDLKNLQVVRDSTILFMNNLGKDSDDNEKKFNKLIDSTKEVFNLINESIKLLASKVQEAESLNTDTINLIASISSNLLNEKEQEKSINEIREKLVAYKEFILNIDNTFQKNDKKLEKFFSDSYTQSFLDKYCIVIDYFNRAPNGDKRRFGDNYTLVISEKDNKVYLPYTVYEIKQYKEKFPKRFKSEKDLIDQIFIRPLSYYQRYPVISRFREAYSLIRDREQKSVFEALKYALILMPKSELNPAIIAACKYQDDLNIYLDCLKNNKLEKFKIFKIIYELHPLK